MKQCFRPQRLLRLLVLVLISLFAGVSLYQWNASTLTGNEMPMPFGVGVSVVLSGSMEPQLQVNDLVLVQRQEEYVPGDVVVYQSGRSLVIHQLLESRLHIHHITSWRYDTRKLSDRKSIIWTMHYV